MPDDPDRDPISSWLVAAAEAAARDEGQFDRLGDMPAAAWKQVLAAVATRATRDGVALPAGWETSLDAHRAAARLRADRDDATLAEKGEVFSREDDA